MTLFLVVDITRDCYLASSLGLARISHQTLGKLETSVSPLHPRISLGKVYKPSLRKLLGASKKQSAQSSSGTGEKCGLATYLPPSLRPPLRCIHLAFLSKLGS